MNGKRLAWTASFLVLACCGKVEPGDRGEADAATQGAGMVVEGGVDSAPDAGGASDGGCSYPPLLMPDAATGLCGVSPADLACNVDSDCTFFSLPQCGCIQQVYGVNQSAMPLCIAPGCPPLPQDEPCDPSGNQTQDCRLVPYGDVAAHCINHQCTTAAP
jgi:hypothetical protein